MCNCGKTRQTGGSQNNNNNSHYYNVPKSQTNSKQRMTSSKDFQKAYREMIYGRTK